MQRFQPLLYMSKCRTVNPQRAYHCLCTSKTLSTRESRLVSLSQRFLSSETKGKARGPVTWASLAVLLLTGGGIVAYVRYVKEEKRKEKEKELKKSVGMAAIGGPFELINTEGATVTDQDFHGKWVLLYFGFCHCPDICPDQLDKMTEVVNKLDSIAALPKIQPVFVTVDPHRDTKEAVKEYLKDFHPRMIGLTGTEEQVKKVCKAYRVYYSAGPKDEDEDYIVDHTIITYLIGPDGGFVEYYGQNRVVDEIVGAISTRMALSRKKTSP